MDKTTNGWLSGFAGVLIFSGSLPATRLAVQGLDPVFLTVARATIAGTLGLLLLLVFRQTRPAQPRSDSAGRGRARRGGRLSAADGARACVM